MTVFRVEKTNNYTIMSNEHFKEKKMSLKAKGLLSLILSLPPNWDYSIAGLVSLSNDGETSVKSALKELEDFGYLRIDKLYPNQSETGRIEYIYNIFESPKKLKQGGEKQGVENLPVEILSVENQGELNTNKLNTKNKIKNNISVGRDKPAPLLEISKTSSIRKKENIITMLGMLNGFSQNEKVLGKLKEYFEMRVKKGLQPNQWKIILEDLRKFTNNNADLAIDKINNAIAGGYMQIIAAWEKDKQYNTHSKPHFDNTTGRQLPKSLANMNKEEKETFKRQLPADNDGNFINF